MAKTNKKVKQQVPGSIYQNGSRWWWRVKLPGEKKITARPLKPLGSNYATKDFDVAVEIAKEIHAKTLFKSDKQVNGKATNISELVKLYLQYVDRYYVDTLDQPNGEAQNIRYSVAPLIDLFACVPVEEFGPVMLMDVREKMIDQNIVRKTVNQRISRIKRMFKWAVSQQLISPFVFQAISTVEGLKRGRTISTVEGLKRGRTRAKEGRKVKPVAEEHVYAILSYTTPVVATMVELQLITGMRPGELVQLRPKDIDRSDAVWHYYPEKHKNEFRGHERVVSIGPRGQQILAPYLLRPEDKCCFSPAESEKIRRQILHENRKTPMSCGNKPGLNKTRTPQKQPGESYDPNSYRKAINSAINRARADIKANGGDPDKELPKWTPYQLRHTAATKARKMFNYETAGALLGHNKMSATAIYAERNQGLADEAARKFG